MPTQKELANAIRALSMDAVQRANSGHPGAPLGMADIAQVLWSQFLKHNPADPNWHNRDRFVLSNGHGSMLIYALLHLSGYDLSIDDIRQFRQLHSKTAGHPEYGITPGVETTTGPLGQGLANAVGMAVAERTLAARFNRPDFDIVDHRTFVFLGDGCLMEGISHEACSLAGTLGLGKLICIYDDNQISIDGDVRGWFSDDTPSRFRAYGWHVVEDVDGHDANAVTQAIEVAEATNKPSLICCKTTIGWGSPNKAGTAASHGSPLGDDEVALVRETINWPHDPFDIPDDIQSAWDAREAGAARQAEWQALFDAYAEAYPDLAAEYVRRVSGQLPEDFDEHADAFIASTAEAAIDAATRKSSQHALNGYCPKLPEMVGGSADLTGSNNTLWSGSRGITADNADGDYIYYGVREFGMSAIMNGMALHGGFKPYGGTFLVFSDYARNAVRMAALMKVPVSFVYTHDSIGLGEDGPTHQAVEHIASLRLMPGLNVWRPCDAVESAVAWRAAVSSKHTPHALVFSRQNAKHQNRSDEAVRHIARGGYVLRDTGSKPQVILIATGTEVQLATAAADTLADKIDVRVVSMPCTEVFNAQDAKYRDSVLPASVTRRVAIEAGVSDLWWRYVGPNGKVLGVDRYGESAPAADVYNYFGLTVDGVVAAVESLL
ncbi:MAG: transketolase [Pseudomonadota bacterium]